MFYVYILKSLKDGKLYIGYTSDLKKRFAQHKAGEVFNTKHRAPIELVYYEAYKNIDDAKEREKSFKHSGSVHNGLVKRIKRSMGA